MRRRAQNVFQSQNNVHVVENINLDNIMQRRSSFQVHRNTSSICVKMYSGKNRPVFPTVKSTRDSDSRFKASSESIVRWRQLWMLRTRSLWASKHFKPRSVMEDPLRSTDRIRLTVGSLNAKAKSSSRSRPSSCNVENSFSLISAGSRRPLWSLNRRVRLSSTEWSEYDKICSRLAFIVRPRFADNWLADTFPFGVPEFEDIDVDTSGRSEDEAAPADEEVDGFDVRATLEASDVKSISSSPSRPMVKRQDGLARTQRVARSTRGSGVFFSHTVLLPSTPGFLAMTERW